MMKISRISILVILTGMLCIYSCDKTSSEPEPEITLDEITNISETGFKVKWTANKINATKAFIVATNANPTSSFIYRESINDLSLGSQSVSGLHGASRYSVIIEVETEDGSVKRSNAKSVATSYYGEDVKIKTEDNIEVAAQIGYLSSLSSQRPGIIFMHELGAFVNNWKNSEVVRQLIAGGYVCMVIDFRGHGNSTPIDDLGILVEDWSLVVKDLNASIEYLKNHNKVQANKLALAGGSLGGIMALAGNGYDEVITSVALSAPRMGTDAIFPGKPIKSAYYIAGELDERPDPYMNFADEATKMYEQTEDPKKLSIIKGVSSHGTELLVDEELVNQVVSWIHLRMNEQ